MSQKQNRRGPRSRRAASVVALALSAAVVLGACGSTATTTGSAGTVAPAPPGTNGLGALGSTPQQPMGDAVEIKIVMSPYGPALGRGNGKVLYAWDKETDGSTICQAAACVEKWPPLTASVLTFGDGVDKAQFSLVDRPDGSKQVAIDGRRLYTMAIDNPGEANCQGSEGWWILHADGTKNDSTTPSRIGTTVPTAPTTTAFVVTSDVPTTKSPTPTPSSSKAAPTTTYGY